jgi:hypothetical protein
MSEEGFKTSQYEDIFNKLKNFLELSGNDDYEISINVVKNILKLNEVINTCNTYNVNPDLLFDVDENKFQNFLRLYNKTLSVELNISKSNLLLEVVNFVNQKYNIYISNITRMNHRDIKLTNDAYNLFLRNIISFKYKIEQLKTLEEIKLEKLRYQTINKEQIDRNKEQIDISKSQIDINKEQLGINTKQIHINKRNSRLTLLGIIITGALTIANIIVTLKKNC